MSEQPKNAPEEVAKKAPKATPKQALDRVKASADARASLDAVKAGVEKKEEYDTIFHTEYASGSYELTAADRAKLPEVRREFTHWAIAGADGQVFNPNKLRDVSWYEDMSDAARLFARLYTNGQIQTNFPTMRAGTAQIMLNMIDRFAQFEARHASGQITINAFKSNLEKEFGRDNVYGSDGVLNMLLALKRAHAGMQGQELPTTLYDLRLAKSKFTSAYRFTELRRKKEVAAEKHQATVKLSEQGPSEVAAMRPNMEKLATEMKEKYGVDVTVTLKDDPKGNPAFILTTKDPDGKDLVLGRMKMVYDKDAIGDGPFKFYSTIDQEAAYARFLGENFDDPKDAEKHLRSKIKAILTSLVPKVKEATRLDWR